MHMQQGIGQAGYRLLALVFFTVGLGGLLVAWAATRFAAAPVFQSIGLATAAAALGLLLFLSLVLSLAPATPPRPAEDRRPKAAPAEAAPDAQRLDFEYEDHQPAPRAAPESLVLPQAFQEDPAPALDTGGLVTFEARPAPPPAAPRATQPAPPEPRREMRDRYTRNTPLVRQALADEKRPEAPLARAERCPEGMDDPDWITDGKTRGRCGGCSTMLLAPAERPLRLRCPQCGRVTLLS